MRTRLRWIARRYGLLLALLAACAPEPTPFPVDVPTAATPAYTTSAPNAAPTAANPEASSLRYALASNTAGFVADLPLLEQAAQVITLGTPVNPADLGSRYDVIAAYGDLPGGQRSPIEHQVALVFNPALPPTHDSAVVAALKRAISPSDIANALDIPGAVPQATDVVAARTVREELANAGWPDGFDLELAAANAPGAAPIMAVMRAVNVAVRAGDLSAVSSAFESGAAHLALIVWASPDDRAAWETRVGTANILPLYTLPISYLAVPGLNISYTPAGWPFPRR